LPNFLALDGGDGYTMFKGAPVLVSTERAQIDSDILSRAIIQQKLIAPKTDGRIKRLDKTQTPQGDCKD
jgi:hypothetical protein